MDTLEMEVLKPTEASWPHCHGGILYWEFEVFDLKDPFQNVTL